MEFRISLTIAEHGFDGNAADAVMDSFEGLFPDSGPVVTQDTGNGALTITIALDATDPWAAANLARKVFADGLNHAGLAVTPVLDVSVTAVDPDGGVIQRESWDLVPA